MTMMYSPIGGWQDAIGGEIADLKKKGWFAEGEEGYVDGWAEKRKKKTLTVEKINSMVAEVVKEVRPAKSLAEQYEAKFGKKPHWKTKPETIEAALKD